MDNSMNSMTIELPDALREYVQTQAHEGGYSSMSEYVHDLIRADQLQKSRQLLEAELLKGLQSGEAEPLAEADWNDLRDQVRRRHRQRQPQR